MNISILQENCVNNDKGGIPVYVESVCQVNDLYELSVCCIQNHICISVFNDNYRKGENWISTDFMTFDFDNGKVLSSQINERLIKGNINHSIIASKNHLKDKGDGLGIIERFHVFIPFDGSITIDPDLYKYITTYTVNKLGWKEYVDGAASVDKCRYYFKHSQVLHIHEDGENISIQPFINRKRIEKEMQDELTIKTYYKNLRKQKKMEKYKETYNNIFRSPVEKFQRTKYYEMLKNEMNTDGTRYDTSNRIMGAMKLCGVEIGDCMSLFDQYSTYGKGFTRKSVETRYNKWS